MSGPHVSPEQPVFKLPAVPAGPAPGALPEVPVRVKSAQRRHTTSQVGLPAIPFLFTLDQIATILSLPTEEFKSKGYVFYEGRSTYIKKSSQMSARNIAPNPTDAPVWRVLDQELVRWMKLKGFRYYEAGVFYETDKFQED